MQDYDSIITRNIKREIELSFKSKSQIADEIGVAKPTISQYLSGRIQPTLYTLAKLCICLDCSADDILGINDLKALSGANTNHAK